jgi:ketosteroid isomerase-like protein
MSDFITRIHRATLLFVLALSLPVPGHTQTTDDTNTFVALQNQWAEARKNQDVAFLEKFYAAEFMVGNMNGAESTRAQDIGMFSSGDMKPAVITDSDIKVQYGDAALVTGTEHLEGSYKGQAGQFDLRFANVYVYRDGRWQMVRHQATQIRPRQPASPPRAQ